MKNHGSKSGELDKKNIMDIMGAFLIFLATTYLANTDIFNSILANYIGKEQFVAVT
jgi:hypothetical protein